jgi:hypothetical protein
MCHMHMHAMEEASFLICHAGPVALRCSANMDACKWSRNAEEALAKPHGDLLEISNHCWDSVSLECVPT